MQHHLGYNLNMALSSHYLIISALFIGLRSADEYFPIHEHTSLSDSVTTISIETRGQNNTVNSQLAELTSPPYSTESVTLEPIDTTSAPEPTIPPDKVITEPDKTTMIPEATVQTDTSTWKTTGISVPSQPTHTTDTVSLEQSKTTFTSQESKQTHSVTPISAVTTPAPETSNLPDTVTPEPAETTMVPTASMSEPTAQTDTSPSLSTVTTSTQPTLVTDRVSFEPTKTTLLAQETMSTDSVASGPTETTLLPDTTASTTISRPTVTTTVAESSISTTSVVSVPADTTSTPEPTTTTVTLITEPDKTTMVPEATVQTDTSTWKTTGISVPSQPTHTTDTVSLEQSKTTFTSQESKQTHSVTPIPDVTTPAPETSNLPDTVTPEPAETTMVPTASMSEPTAQTDTSPSLSTVTTSTQPTLVTDRVSLEPAKTTLLAQETMSTDSVTSDPDKTSTAHEPPAQTNTPTLLPTKSILTSQPTDDSGTGTPESFETTLIPKESFSTHPVTSGPTEATLLPETTAFTKTYEPSVTTSSFKTTSPTDPLTTISTVTPTALVTERPRTLPTTKPTTPTSKATTGLTTAQPTTTTTQTTSRPFTTAKPKNCQNGGYLNGSNCICLVGFSGELCQFVETFEPVQISRSVVVDVLINQEYNERYENKTSSEYKEFVRNFTEQMADYYHGKKIPNFKEVVVISVRRGGPLARFLENTVEAMILSAMAIYTVTPREQGVRVIHDVVLAISNNASSEDLYEDNFKAVEEAVGELVDCIDGCPYNVTTSPIVNTTELDLQSLCEKFLSDSDIAEYYEPVSVNGAITCVTVCNSLHLNPKTCYNKGICQVYKDIGPLCHCQNVNSTWYLDNDCRFPIQRTAFYAGLSVTLACLLVTVGALTTYMLINKHKQAQRRDIEDNLVKQWMNEDFEWSRSNSQADTNNAGDYRNPSFIYEESASHREITGDFGQPIPDYQLTQPDLDTNSRQSSPFSTRSLSLPPTSHSSSNLPMTIGRPQIRTSWDA